MGMFGKGIKDAKIFGKGTNIRDGRYVFLIESVKEQRNQKNEEQFIAELRVVEATATGEYEIDSTGKATTSKLVAPNAVGSSCSYVQVSKHDSAMSNIKAFLLGAMGGLGYTEEDLNEENYNAAISEGNPLRGVKVACETVRTLNQGKTNAANRGNILVLPRWSSVKQTEDDLAAGKKFLDENKAKAAPAEEQKAAPAPAPTPAPEPAKPAVTTPAPGGKLGNLLGRKAS